MLETNRLFLRPFLIDDASEIFRLNAAPEVMRYLPKDEVYRQAGEAELFLSRYLETMKDQPYARWAVIRKEDDGWLGWCGLKLQADGETDLGFRLHQEYWGNGYATEAGRAWLGEGFGTYGLPRIIAQTTAGNLGSQGVLTKLGFQRKPTDDYDEDGFRWWRYAISPNDQWRHSAG